MTTTPPFVPFGKIPRYNRTAIVTEKIDGSNAQVCITQEDLSGGSDDPTILDSWTETRSEPAMAGFPMVMRAGSRKRWITPDADNFGFAQWVKDNAGYLRDLGPGQHFGEWYGAGIQRRYGLDHKRFALFNATRWTNDRPCCCDVVPILANKTLDCLDINGILEYLRVEGSQLVPGFMDPEGIILYHTAGRQVYKATLTNDAQPKGDPS